jgi:tight adherence protein B
MESMTILAILIFTMSVAIIISGIYFFLIAPSQKKKLRDRMELAKTEILMQQSANGEAGLLRSEILSGVPILNRILISIPGAGALNLFIQQSAAEITVGFLLTISFFSGWVTFLLCLLFKVPLSIAFVFGCLAFSVPFLVIGIKRQRRFLKFEEQFPDAIELLGRAVRAGHAFTTGLSLISKEMPSPISDEFERTYEQQNLGLPLRAAFENLMRRMPLTDVRIFVTALMIQRESGGNLAEILDNLADVIRDRFKLVRQIKVYTAQGRLSLYMLIAIPPIMALLLYTLDKEYIMRLFTDPLGHRFLVVGIVMQVLGYFTIRKIIQPKY